MKLASRLEEDVFGRKSPKFPPALMAGSARKAKNLSTPSVFETPLLGIQKQMILSTVRGHSFKMQQACCQATEVTSGLAHQTSSETTLDEDKHEWTKKKTGPRKLCPPGKIGDRLPFCWIQRQAYVLLKDFNLSRHYNTTHKGKYDKYSGVAWATIIIDLRGKIHRQQSFFTKTSTTQDSTLKASYASPFYTVSLQVVSVILMTDSI